MPDINRNYYVLQSLARALYPEDKIPFTAKELSDAIAKTTHDSTNIKNPKYTLSGDFDLSYDMFQALGKNLNKNWTNVPEDAFNNEVNAIGTQYDQAHDNGYTLLSRSDPRASTFYLFKQLMQSQEYPDSLDAFSLGIGNDSFDKAFSETQSGKVVFKNQLPRHFAASLSADELSDDAVTIVPFIDDRYSLQERQSVINLYNQTESKRDTVQSQTRTNNSNNGDKSNKKESEFDRVKNKLGAFITPNDLTQINHFLADHPEVHYSDEVLDKSAQGLIRLYDQGFSFELRPGTAPGQFDAVVGGPTRNRPRILDTDPKYIGRDYVTNIGYSYPSNHTNESLDVGALTDFTLGIDGYKPTKTGRMRYQGITPVMTSTGGSVLKTYGSGPNGFMAPLSNRDSATKSKQRFLNNMQTDYDENDGLRVSKFYLAQARDQLFAELGQPLDSLDTDVKNAQDSIKTFFGEKSIDPKNTYVPSAIRKAKATRLAQEQANGNDVSNINPESASQVTDTLSMVPDSDQFAKMAVNELRAQSILAQQQAADPAGENYRVEHQVAQDDLARANSDHAKFTEFRDSLDDDAKEDLDAVVTKYSELADNIVGKLAENTEDMTIEPNRIADFADHVHSLSITGDFRDAYSVTPLKHQMIGPEYSQTLGKDRSLNFDMRTAKTYGQLYRSQRQLNSFEQFLIASDSPMMHDVSASIDKFDNITFHALDQDGQSIEGTIPVHRSKNQEQFFTDYNLKSIEELEQEDNDLFKASVTRKFKAGQPEVDPSLAKNADGQWQLSHAPIPDHPELGDGILSEKDVLQWVADTQGETAAQSMRTMLNQYKSVIAQQSRGELDKLDLKIDTHPDNFVVQFDATTKPERWANGKVSRDAKSFSGIMPVGELSRHFADHSDVIYNSYKAVLDHQIANDEPSARDTQQLSALMDTLKEMERTGYDLGYRGKATKSPVFYKNRIEDPNDPSGFKTDEHGAYVFETGINPNGVTLPDADPDQKKFVPNTPTVRVDGNGVAQYEGFRSVGNTSSQYTNVTDEHGVALIYHVVDGEFVEIEPKPQWIADPKEKNGGRYDYTDEQKELLTKSKVLKDSNGRIKYDPTHRRMHEYSNQKVQSARFFPAVKITGHFGQILSPNKQNVTQTNFESGDNFAMIGGGNAYFTPVGMEGPNPKTLAERFKVISYQTLLNRAVRAQMRLQSVKPLANIPDTDGATIQDALEPKLDKYGHFTGYASAKPVQLAAPLDSTSLNTYYHKEFYGEKLQDNFVMRNKTPWDLKMATLSTLSKKVRFPNMYRDNGNSFIKSADSEQADNRQAGGYSDTVTSMFNNLNLRMPIDELNGTLDRSATGSGKLEGISNFLTASMTVDNETGQVVYDDSFDGTSEEAQNTPVGNTKYFKYSFATPADRLQMAYHQSLTSDGVDDNTETMMSTFGGFTYDDAMVISRDFAERNPIDINSHKGANPGPTEETLAWFNHEIDGYINDETFLGGQDWGADTRKILRNGSQLKTRAISTRNSFNQFLEDNVPNQDIELSDDLNTRINSNDPDVKAKATSEYKAQMLEAKSDYAKAQIKALNTGETTEMDPDKIELASQGFSAVQFCDKSWKDYQNQYGTTRPLKIGDKLSNFPGNKGIISLVVDRNMNPAEAKKVGLEREVAIFHKNPKLDTVQSPNSVVSRNNMSFVLEMKGNMKHNETQQDRDVIDPTTGKIIGEMGRSDTIITNIDAEDKTHVYNGSDAEGRKFSSQLVWALQEHGANNVIKEAFSQNNRAWHDYREYLMATGLDLSSNGDYQVGYHPHAGEDRKVYTLDNDLTADNKDELTTIHDSDDFFRKMGSSGGMLKLPFEVKLASGVMTDQLPVLSAGLRKTTQQLDGQTINNDYTNNYGMIVNAAQDYLTAKNDGKPTENLKADVDQQVLQLENKIVNDRLGGPQGESLKKSIVRTNIIAKRLQNSATAPWSADPRVDLDTVKVSPAIYDAVAPKDENGNVIPYDSDTGRPQEKADNRVMLWRDPCLHAGSVRSFKIQVDPTITGVAINPVNDKPFDGDFDGDTVGIMRFDSPEAQADLEKISVPNNLIAPHSKDVPQSEQESQINTSMDFVSGFKEALDDPSGKGFERINNILGDDALTKEDLGFKVDENGKTQDGTAEPIKYKQLLNRSLVSIASNNSPITAVTKSEELVNLCMRDYNFGSAQMRFSSWEKTNQDIIFQQDNGIKGKPGKRPFLTQATDDNGKQLTDKNGQPKMKLDWEKDPIDPTTGQPMKDYVGFSPVVEPKIGADGLKVTDQNGNIVPKLDEQGHAIPVKDADGNVQMKRDTVQLNGQQFNGQPSALGKCKLYQFGMKDKSGDNVFGDAWKNMTRDIREAMGVKTDDTGIAGTYSQSLFSVLRTVNPEAALEVTYPLTQAVLQIKHDADQAHIIHDALNGPIKNLYAGHDRNYQGESDKEHNQKLTAKQWTDQMVDVTSNELGVDLDPGLVAQVADAMTGPDGKVIGLDDLMVHKAAQIDISSFGKGFATINDQAHRGVNVMGPSNEVANEFAKSKGHAKFSELSETEQAELLSQRTAANDMRPADIDDHIKGIAEGKDAKDLIHKDVSLSNHGKDYDTQDDRDYAKGHENNEHAHETKQVKVSDQDVFGQSTDQVKDFSKIKPTEVAPLDPFKEALKQHEAANQKSQQPTESAGSVHIDLASGNADENPSLAKPKAPTSEVAIPSPEIKDNEPEVNNDEQESPKSSGSNAPKRSKSAKSASLNAAMDTVLKSNEDVQEIKPNRPEQPKENYR